MSFARFEFGYEPCGFIFERRPALVRVSVIDHVHQLTVEIITSKNNYKTLCVCMCAMILLQCVLS